MATIELELVKHQPNVFKLPTAHHVQVVEFLERLLAQAKAGKIVGIAGIFLSNSTAIGHYLTGACCEEGNATINGLYDFSYQLQRSH